MINFSNLIKRLNNIIFSNKYEFRQLTDMESLNCSLISLREYCNVDVEKYKEYSKIIKENFKPRQDEEIINNIIINMKNR